LGVPTTGDNKSSGLQLGTSSTGGLQLGTGGGLKLGMGGLQSSGVGLLTNVQPASGESIKLTASSAESTSTADSLGGVKLSLLGRKRPAGHAEDEAGSNKAGTSNTGLIIGNRSLLGDTKGLPALNRPTVATTKSVTFNLDSEAKNTDSASSSGQALVGIAQPSSAGSGLLTSSGFSLGSSLTSGDNKLPVASEASKPFANLFPQASTASSSVLNFQFAKSTSASSIVATTTSMLLNATLSFNTGIVSSSVATASSTDPPKLFNFSQQSLFTIGQNQQHAPSGRFDLKLPTCQEKKETTGNITFNFSGAKNSESSQGQQGW